MKIKMLSVFGIVVTVLGLAPSAGADDVMAGAPYYRFWQGNRRTVWYNNPNQVFTAVDFVTKLNEWLIPATTSCCAKESLLAYLPVVPAKKDKTAGVHDEYAIIVYRSAEIYNQVRNDPNNHEANVYGPLHADVFEIGQSKTDPKSSRSLEPQVYEDAVDLAFTDKSVALKEKSYDVLAKQVDWRGGYSTFRVLTRNEPNDGNYQQQVGVYLSQIKKNADDLKLKGYVVLVDDQKIVEYQNWATGADYQNFVNGPDSQSKVLKNGFWIWAAPTLQTKKDPLSYVSIDYGHGASIQFTPGVKPGQVHHPLLGN